MQLPTVGVVIPTLNAGPSLRRTILAIRGSAVHCRLLIVDSQSRDGTPELAREEGAEVLPILRKDFNHGATRERARKELNTDITVFLTQDAVPACDDLIARLTRPIVSREAEVSYARQVPRPNAGLIESFTRHFNYPSSGHIRSLEDVARLGSLTFFCSNSCAAYNNVMLDSIGGFPAVLMAEDTIAVAALLIAGGRIAYVPDAVVEHSHDHSLIHEFRRHFDTGYVREVFTEVFSQSSDKARGRLFAEQLVKVTLRERPILLPAVLAALGAKYAGYLLGRIGPSLPRTVCRWFSSNPLYWAQGGR